MILREADKCLVIDRFAGSFFLLDSRLRGNDVFMNKLAG
jgi:hypothetical protein